MSIRRRKKTQQFTQINNSAALNPRLSLKAKGLLLVMMTRPEDWVFYMDWLQKQSRDGREAHQNALKELERQRYVIRLRVQRANGTFKGWEYIVDDEPITDIEPGVTVIRDDEEPDDEPTNGKPVYRLPAPPTDERENRQSGKPSIGKPATTNTDLTKKEIKKIVVVEAVENFVPVAPQADPQEPTEPPVLDDNNNSFFEVLEKEKEELLPAEAETAQPPVGGSANADITDKELEFLSGLDNQEVVNLEDTNSENIPPAAAPPVPAPQEAREAPAARVPSTESRATVWKLLASKLGGVKRLTSLLAEPGRDNVRQKASWLDLEPEKVQGILVDAQANCQKEEVTFITAITRRLDVALGARAGRQSMQLVGPAMPLPQCYEVKPSLVVAELLGQSLRHEKEADLEAPALVIEVGSQWKNKKDEGKIVTVTNVQAGKAKLDDGNEIFTYELGSRYISI